MAPCECLDEKVKKIIDAIREMDSREFEMLLARSEREGRTVDELIEDALTKSKNGKKT
ncbi:MAG: hypothetical protein JRN26_03080 [Nitrososphaerota archaeon]|jgi:hypothetical protein|nr:hypothetical protein [Nitrososphaerota archaeon]MDG6930621.1 hypothetical protein [Nitrososphaerota archaeon]MDG6932754.1 hypothetical protein [Nitrososphaerota archaeon]MDG6935857.1 hypothetical protein [Nitrososphaerota archaeon]MDG6944178.1 hypothetical protein [Nitrososphaerota archaeon]